MVVVGEDIVRVLRLMENLDGFVNLFGVLWYLYERRKVLYGFFGFMTRGTLLISDR